MKIALLTLAGLLGVYAGLCLVGGRMHREGTDQALDQLRAEAPERPATVSHVAIEASDLPPIVKTYLKRALLDGAPIPRLATVRQRGGFRLKAGADFMDMQATQLFAVQGPGMVWQARMEMLPGLPIFVRDSFLDGRGAFGGRVLGLIPVVSGTGPDVDEATMIRYLSETIWLPYALLPGPNLRWEAAGERAARVSLKCENRTVVGIYTFDASGRPVKFDAERPRDVGGHSVRTLWHVVLENHQHMSGVEIPVVGSVSWILPEGALEYGRFEIVELSFQGP